MVQYRDGKKVPPKQAKEYSKKKFSRDFVHQLEEHLKEFAEGYKTIPQKEIPEKLKTIINQLQYDINHFLRNYEMTEAIVNVKDGKPVIPGNQPLEALKFEVLRLNEAYKEEHGSAKYMPYKDLVLELESLNKTRQDEGLQPLKIISSRTYDEWKKQFKAEK
jgi:hypothetical protein